MTFSNMAGLKKRIFSENRPKLKKKSIFLAKTVPNIGISPGFLLIKKGNGVPESFSTIPCRYFSKWRLEVFWGGNHPLPSKLWRLTLPPSKGVPRFLFCFCFGFFLLLLLFLFFVFHTHTPQPPHTPHTHSTHSHPPIQPPTHTHHLYFFGYWAGCTSPNYTC